MTSLRKYLEKKKIPVEENQIIVDVSCGAHTPCELLIGTAAEKSATPLSVEEQEKWVVDIINQCDKKYDMIVVIGTWHWIGEAFVKMTRERDGKILYSNNYEDLRTLNS
jgi:hypothetical protein